MMDSMEAVIRQDSTNDRSEMEARRRVQVVALGHHKELDEEE